MNIPRSVSVVAVAALVAVSGCAKKKPAELPPPPATSATSGSDLGDGTGAGGRVGTGVLPGSRAEFLAQAGTDTIHFATDSSDIDGEAAGILRAQARWLTAHPSVRVTVEGHCDERGTREFNLALGERRANAAKNALAAAGIAADRINVISYGKERPVAEGSDEASWGQNRRAVTVVPQ